ncbi:MAG: hypothetical protein ACPIOQ_18510, partial [Promethearchaeia archaeon]
LQVSCLSAGKPWHLRPVVVARHLANHVQGHQAMRPLRLGSTEPVVFGPQYPNETPGQQRLRQGCVQTFASCMAPI